MNKKLLPSEYLTAASALFSMHFGASCMLYPLTWGKETGSAFGLAYIGVLISGVILPLLAYLALSKGKGDLITLTKRTSPRFALVFCSIVAMVIGPLYVVPRISAAAWEAIARITNTHLDSSISIAFSAVYHLILYWFVAKRNKIVDRIGKILFPVLLCFIALIICKGLITPVNEVRPQPTCEIHPTLYGFFEGYEPGDLLCALFFGMVIVQSIKDKLPDSESTNSTVLKVAMLGCGLIAIIHLGHMMVGSTIGNTIDLTYSQLYAETATTLWGPVGGIFFSIALLTASLTSGAGLTAASTEYWGTVLKEKFYYERVALISVIASFLISILGFSRIVVYIGPILDVCYPATTVLVIYYVAVKKWDDPERLNGLLWAMIAAIILGLLETINFYCSLTMRMGWYCKLYSFLPLAKQGFTWAPASFAVYHLRVQYLKRKSATKLG